MVTTKTKTKKATAAGKVATTTKTKAGAVARKGFPAKKTGTARAAGGAKKPGLRPGQFVFQAPADFKPHFLEVLVRTEKDGLLSHQIKATRYVGKYNPQAEDKKKFDLGAYDSKTLIGIMARLSAKTFKTNGQKIMPQGIKERNVTTKVRNAAGESRDKFTFGSGYRLPANSTFSILLRVGASKVKGNILTVGLKHVEQSVKIEKSGVKKVVRRVLDKKDPAYRMIAGAKRFLPAAFQEVLLPPKRTRGANKPKDEGDDE